MLFEDKIKGFISSSDLIVIHDLTKTGKKEVGGIENIQMISFQLHFRYLIYEYLHILQ